MKVLLTGANGFVGSHVLDRLVDSGVPVRLLLRDNADRRFIRETQEKAECVGGSLGDVESLRRAVQGVTHVIHCAGKTKAFHRGEYFLANEEGTRQLVQAANRENGIEQFLHISSLAAAGPATLDRPSLESDPCHPVSHYGQSKLAGEEVVKKECRAPFCILRPAAVYGPRDRDFLTVFKAVRSGWVPVFGGGKQAVSLIYVRDVAAGIVSALDQGRAVGETFNLAAEPAMTNAEIIVAVAAEAARKVRLISLPWTILSLACATQEVISRAGGRPHILSRQKFRELSAPGWVCDAGKMRAQLGFSASTPLAIGLGETGRWYRERGDL